MILEYLFAVVVLLSVLIFVHELGHFWAAKACGVRVLKFSVGFGSPIGFGRFRARWERSGTEYVVAWFPLGGFVKMLGENPDEEDAPEAQANPDETLGAKSLWQKLLIVFAGPAMNLIFPVLLFAGMQWVGLPRDVAEVGLVEQGSPAAAAGVVPGERVLAIDGAPIEWWGEVYEAVRDAAGETLVFQLEARDGSRRSLSIPVTQRPGIDVYGQAEEAGWIGVASPRPAALLAVAAPATPAQQAGLRSGDLVTRVGDAEVADWYALAQAYAAAEGEVTLEVTRADGEATQELSFRVPALGSLEALGIRPASALISAVSEDSPASRAGLQAGDVVVAYDGRPVTYFDSFAQAVSSSGGEPRQLQFLREGALHEITIAAEPIETETDVAGPRHRLGVAGSSALVRGATAIDRERNPLVAVPRAVEMTVSITRGFLRGLSMLVTGDVSSKNLAGPIGIAQMAGDQLRKGWANYMQLMVLISINLGILNLLPIPILDGGQATLFLVEAAKRSPLSLRTKLAVQQVGLTMLLMLMGLAFWNDLSRLWTQMVGSLPPGP